MPVAPRVVPRSAERARTRALLCAACAALLAVPFLCVRFAPVTDLPQHIAQIRLLHEALADPASPYRIQWLTPYALGYLPLAAAWTLAPSETAGRLAMIALAALWAIGVHGLAANRRRPAAAAVLASVLFFNHDTYWGFYSFEVGWVAFVPWLALTTRPESARVRWSDVPLYLGAAALLYASHALWLAAGVAWLVVRSLVAGTPLRALALRLAALSPVLALAAVWHANLTAAGFSGPTRWLTTPTGRLSITWLADSILGGLRGPVEYVVLILLAGWVAAAVRGHRGRLGAAVDRDLCLAAGFLFALALVLPNLYQNTISFGSRWLPMAAVLLLLALPAPAWDRKVANAAALALLSGFAVYTALAWMRFERDEYSGMAASLDALPAERRVIGLDYVKTSDVIAGRPFLQSVAYAQVIRGASLSFSFAEFAPMVVVYRETRRTPWTRGLEWFPERLRRSDFAWFDYALVNADAPRHAALAQRPALRPVTDSGRWRLYRVEAPGR